MTVCQRGPKTGRNAVVMHEPENRSARKLRKRRPAPGHRFVAEGLERNKELKEKSIKNYPKRVLVPTRYIHVSKRCVLREKTKRHASPGAGGGLATTFVLVPFVLRALNACECEAVEYRPSYMYDLMTMCWYRNNFCSLCSLNVGERQP